MKPSLTLEKATILVTGATGFIGGRLVEHLVSYEKIRVRALVRNYGRAVRLARWPIELVPGDLRDPDALQKAVANCDLVFHCAFGSAGDAATQRAITVDGTRNLIEASLAAKVKRFIHISTIAVHGPDPGPIVDEDTPLLYSDNVYADSKLDAEKIAWQFAQEKGLPLVVIRPTIVYGPRANGWTIGPVNQIKEGKLSLIEGGAGMANHVYVDDVVQALLLSAIRPQSVGEAFVVSQGTCVTWHEFFGHYAEMLGVELPSLTLAEISEQRQRRKELKNPVNMSLTFLASPHAQSIVRGLPAIGPAIGLILRLVPKGAKRALLNRATILRESKLSPPTPPSQWLIDLFCARGTCQIDKAQRQLGYQPQFSLQEGMELTEAWLRHVRLI